MPLAAGLDVILCVGETLEQRDADQTEAVLDRQLIQGLAGVSADTLSRLTIAYEPVWAIGSPGHGATPQQAQEAHAVIRRRFGQMSERIGSDAAIQYGGSVKPENAAALLGATAWTAPSSAAPAWMPTSFWPSSGLESVNPQPGLCIKKRTTARPTY